ncbi:RRXRR domain-containing protein [Janthinobacterium sp. NKUCC06_STL]|nr:RRXRR domain-containing protein [Janthinobacterium sp. NKUCC06_STL]
MAWIERLRRLAPVAHLAQERERFDTQLLLNSDISGVDYQQVTLAGYEASAGPGRAAPAAVRLPPARWPSPRRRRAPAAARCLTGVTLFLLLIIGLDST